jgi:hypothetical protein
MRKKAHKKMAAMAAHDMERKFNIWASEYSDSGFLSYPKRGLHFIQSTM